MSVAVRERAVSFGSESSYGVDPISPTPSSWFSTRGDAPRIVAIRGFVPCDGVTAIHSGKPHKSFESHCDVSLDLNVKGKSGAAGSTALHDALFKASGFKATSVALTSTTYTPITYHTMLDAPSCTVIEDQFLSSGQYQRAKARGVRGNLAWNLTADQNAQMTFSGLGLFDEMASPASGSPPLAYDASKSCMLVRGLTLSINSTSYAIKAIEGATNWSVEEERTAQGTASLKAVHLKRGDDSRIGGSLTFHDPTLLAQILTSYGTDAIYSFEAILTSYGTDTITIQSKIQFGQYERGGANITEYSVPYFCLPDSGEDDIKFIFT